MMSAARSEHPAQGDRGPGAVERIVHDIKRAIIEYRLPPDSILVETQLAAQFGVSRSPVREALKRLDALGFVRSLPRLGYMVTNVSVADFDEIFQMRLVVEPLAARLAAGRISQRQLDELAELAAQDQELTKLSQLEPDDRQLREATAAEDRDFNARFTRVNAVFHRRIAEASGNARLAASIAELLDGLERYMHLLASSRARDLCINEHVGVVEALQAGNGDLAAGRMYEQLVNDYHVMRRLVIESGDGAVAVLPSVAPAAERG